MHELPTADIVVLALYLVAVVAFGCWFVRRSRNTEGFMAAGRALPGWAVGMSIFGTYLSSNTFIGVPGKAYGTNWNPFCFSLSLPIAALIAVLFFVPFYRRSGGISAYEHLEKRFGTWARSVAMIFYLLTQIARMGSIMVGVAIGLNALLGRNLVELHPILGLDGLGWDEATVNMVMIIVTTGLLVTLYTLLGGIEAVIWTDVAQSIVLLVGAATVAGLLLFGMPGGPGQIFSTGADHGKFSLGSFAPTLTDATFWVVLCYGLVMNLNNFGIDQSFVQRYHTAKSDREATKSVWLAALLYVPVSAVFLFIGTALFAYYQAQPPGTLAPLEKDAAREKLADEGITPDQPGYSSALKETVEETKPADVGDKVLPHFIVTKFYPGMAGLLLAAIFAAAMSSIDTSLNSSATIVLTDFYKRFFRPGSGERESMAVLYLATLGFGALGTGVAVSLIGVKSILDAWWYLSGIFAGGMTGLFLLGLISRKAAKPAAATGFVAGLAATGWIVLTNRPPLPSWLGDWPGWLPQSPCHKLLIPVVGSMTIVLVGTLVAQLIGRRKRESV